MFGMTSDVVWRAYDQCQTHAWCTPNSEQTPLIVQFVPDNNSGSADLADGQTHTYRQTETWTRYIIQYDRLVTHRHKAVAYIALYSIASCGKKQTGCFGPGRVLGTDATLPTTPCVSLDINTKITSELVDVTATDVRKPT